MPELPEVETVVRGLREVVEGKTISRVRTNAPPSVIQTSNSIGRARFESTLEGRTIESIERRGKNILIRLSGELTLWVHLKMTGHFFYLPAADPIGKHDLVVFDFEPASEKKTGTACHLRYNDYRRFGRLRLYPNHEILQQSGIASLGPEPFDISAAQFAALCRSRKRMMKPALIDQSFIAGIGNIYADEALYASRIHPQRITSSLSTPKLKEMHRHINRLLRLAISNMGTSVDSYSGVNGQPGTFQKYLKAYGREGEQCQRCRGKIIREKIGSRSAHFCPRCQRHPR